ncbi:MAG: archease [Candidatus Pacearchaeota archaeon]
MSGSRTKMYETFEHKADIGVRGKARTLEKAFCEAAKAMFSIECNIKKVKPLKKVKIECEAQNIEELFVEWLNALLAQASLHDMLFSEFFCKIKDKKLVGWAKGEKLQEKHEPKLEVKAATYSQLKVYKQNNVWIAQCIVDV